MKYTVLVNKTKKINQNLQSKLNLIKTKSVDNEIILVEEKTYEAFLELKLILKKLNINIEISSSYRTIEEQQNILEEIIKEYGNEYANKYVALPGYSEHHTGLALDVVVVRDGNYTINPDELLNDKDYDIIHKHLYEAGFILRYPKNKENITGYNYEPWHIRYVGKVVSEIIYKCDYCLEEYLTEFSGVLQINKPKDVTSFDIVNDIKHIFGIKRVGHTGTLDPLATGVLVVTIGKATKLVELLTSTEKEYIAGVTLGIETDTLDITGQILKEEKIKKIDNLDTVLNNFKITYLQEVPKYAAVKVAGKKLYEYARNNLEVELPKKEVTIKEINLLEQQDNKFSFKTLVSKGCYIRSLIRDIAYTTNNIAVMNSLIRTKQGKFDINDCSTIEEIKNNNYKLLNIIDCLDYEKIEITVNIEKQILNGVKIKNIYNIKDKVVFTKENKLIAIYQVKDEYLKSYRGFC